MGTANAAIGLGGIKHHTEMEGDGSFTYTYNK